MVDCCVKMSLSYHRLFRCGTASRGCHQRPPVCHSNVKERWEKLYCDFAAAFPIAKSSCCCVFSRGDLHCTGSCGQKMKSALQRTTSWIGFPDWQSPIQALDLSKEILTNPSLDWPLPVFPLGWQKDQGQDQFTIFHNWSWPWPNQLGQPQWSSPGPQDEKQKGWSTGGQGYCTKVYSSKR
jgi:hypothetical protein